MYSPCFWHVTIWTKTNDELLGCTAADWLRANLHRKHSRGHYSGGFPSVSETLWWPAQTGIFCPKLWPGLPDFGGEQPGDPFGWGWINQLLQGFSYEDFGCSKTAWEALARWTRHLRTPCSIHRQALQSVETEVWNACGWLDTQNSLRIVKSERQRSWRSWILNRIPPSRCDWGWETPQATLQMKRRFWKDKIWNYWPWEASAGLCHEWSATREVLVLAFLPIRIPLSTIAGSLFEYPLWPAMATVLAFFFDTITTSRTMQTLSETLRCHSPAFATRLKQLNIQWYCHMSHMKTTNHWCRLWV